MVQNIGLKKRRYQHARRTLFVATWRTHNAIYSTLNHRNRAVWVALLSIVVVTFSGGVSGWSWVLGNPNTDDKWGYVGFLAGAFIGFAIAATLAGAYFCLVEI